MTGDAIDGTSAWPSPASTRPIDGSGNRARARPDAEAPRRRERGRGQPAHRLAGPERRPAGRAGHPAARPGRDARPALRARRDGPVPAGGHGHRDRVRGRVHRRPVLRRGHRRGRAGDVAARPVGAGHEHPAGPGLGARRHRADAAAPGGRAAALPDRRRPLLARPARARSCSSTGPRPAWPRTWSRSTTTAPRSTPWPTSSPTGTGASPTSATRPPSPPRPPGCAATATPWPGTGSQPTRSSSTATCPTSQAAADAVSALLGGSRPPTAILSATTRASLGVVPALHAPGAPTSPSSRSATSRWPMRCVRPSPSSTIPVTRSGAWPRRGSWRAWASPACPVERIQVPARLIERGSGELRP